MTLRAGTRALTAATAAALAASLVGCGDSGVDEAGGRREATGPAHYVDPSGDGGGAPDVRSIDVTSGRNGRLTFRVTLGSVPRGPEQGVHLWLDTDANPETCNTTFEDADGAEYQLSSFIGFDRSGNSFCAHVARRKGCFSAWTPGGWSPRPAPSVRISRSAAGLAISIGRSELGNTDELNFYAVGWAKGNGAPDRAPGAGTFNYTVALGGPRPKARVVRDDGANKAGGRSKAAPVVLTLATHDYALTTSEASEYASAVARRSGGSIRIDVKYGFRFYDVDYERGTIADVRHRAVDLALVGARAWAAHGVESFDPLLAPFLVDTYALEQRVLESPLARQMLTGVDPLGLVGVALFPGELRRPLGLTRPLVRPADYRGARIGMRPAAVARATLVALGARPAGFPATAGGLAGFDGVESGVNTINNNVYDRGARALRANVVLWPRPTTLVMNRHAYDALTVEQQRALRDAGRDAFRPLLATVVTGERASLAAVCRRGNLALVPATPADRAALRRAVQPVYDKLERSSLIRRMIGDIRDLRADEGASVQPLRCPKAKAHSQSDASVLNGTWHVDVTRDDLRAAGAQTEQLERAEGRWAIEFADGSWVARRLGTGDVYRGTYTVDGDVLRETVRSCIPAAICMPESVEEYTWSLYRDRLKLARIPGRPFDLATVAKELTRAR